MHNYKLVFVLMILIMENLTRCVSWYVNTPDHVLKNLSYVKWSIVGLWQRLVSCKGTHIHAVICMFS